MHRAAFAALGLDWRYEGLPIPAELFAETARALGGSGYRGANVTIPHKRAALDLADEATPAARAIGAANTLTFGDDGAVAADNTDAGGLLDALPEPPSGRRALVLGAGGAGRAAAWALREAGAAEVWLWNRTRERGRAVAAELGVSALADPAAALPRVDLLVNATSVGLEPSTSDAEALAALGLVGAPPAVVVELVYGSEPTPVERWARRGGAAVVGGLEVLVRQGARSLAGWSGREPPLEAMRRAVGAWPGPSG
jgi:shikimate dehydrogenase